MVGPGGGDTRKINSYIFVNIRFECTVHKLLSGADRNCIWSLLTEIRPTRKMIQRQKSSIREYKYEKYTNKHKDNINEICGFAYGNFYAEPSLGTKSQCGCRMQVRIHSS